MTDSDVWKAIRETAKICRAERRAKTPKRIDYALKLLDHIYESMCMDYSYEVKNATSGQIVVKLKWFDEVLETFVYYASTGTIQGRKERGIHALIGLIIAADRAFFDSEERE